MASAPGKQEHYFWVTDEFFNFYFFNLFCRIERGSGQLDKIALNDEITLNETFYSILQSVLISLFTLQKVARDFQIDQSNMK